MNIDLLPTGDIEWKAMVHETEALMFIVYEYAACLLVALFSGSLLFTLSAMGVMLWTAGGITWRWSRELVPVSIRPMARWTPEPRVP
jgi:hypothetical protein